MVLFAAGGVLRLWPVFVLGDRFSGLVAIQPGHTLVTGGIFGVIRNPSYLGMLVNALGWGLAFRSGVGVVLAALFIPPLVARIRAEERLLRAQFGAEYEAYCARTSRLIPGVYLSSCISTGRACGVRHTARNRVRCGGVGRFEWMQRVGCGVHAGGYCHRRIVWTAVGPLPGN